MATNYHDVIGQLQAAGLIVDSIEPGKLVRCKVDGDHEKRGWYSLHEITLPDGEQALVGSFGIWYGDNNNAQKVQLRALELSPEQKAAYKARLAEDRKRAEGLRKSVARSASEKAERKWRELVVDGEHDYLQRKGVSGHGLRFAPAGTTIDYDIEGKVREVDVSHAMVIPMCDGPGQVWGLQFILSRTHHADRIDRIGRDKEFWPQGMEKAGKFHWIGGVPEHCILVCEGYATGATPHEATSLPVAVAFDAGNLLHVGQALRKKYKNARLVYLADDDAFATCPDKGCATRFVVADAPENCPACGKPHKRKNTGIDAARAAALATGGIVIAPKFADEASRRDTWLTSNRKLTDWNDLHALEGLAVVRSQIEAALEAEGVRARTAAPARRQAAQPGGGGGNVGRTPVDIRPVHTLTELLARFVIIYGEGDVVFDRELRKLVKLKDVQNLTLSREVYARWAESADRQFAMIENVGFDPTETDAMVTCNVYRGWPTTPREGSCELLLESLWYLCSAEQNAVEVYQWLLKWIAYPIQHPGAKMQSAVVVHGKQGMGKSQFFKALCRIYGDYALTINQSAVENPRNVWLASRLFILAEEVIARKELHHVKNALKDLITGDTVYVDPKFVNPYPERNHVNLVFLSNETTPVILEDDDRRHLVIWTPATPQSEDFYIRVAEEMANGGVAALHDRLLKLDLTGFTPHSRPPMTKAKQDLIDVSLDSTTRFWRALTRGEIEKIRNNTIALTKDLYALYRMWCSENGVHPAPLPKLTNTLEKKHGMVTARKRWYDGYATQGPHGVCIIPQEKPDGPGKTKLIAPERPVEKPEPEWIGAHVDAFRTAVKDYRSTANA